MSSIAGMTPGDLARFDKRGRVFYAAVDSIDGRNLGIRPLSPSITYRTATSNDVDAWWHQRPHDDKGHVRTASIKAGDMLKIDGPSGSTIVNVLRRDPGRIRVMGLGPNDEPFDISARGLLGHYARRGRSRTTT